MTAYRILSTHCNLDISNLAYLSRHYDRQKGFSRLYQYSEVTAATFGMRRSDRSKENEIDIDVVSSVAWQISLHVGEAWKKVML